MEPPCADSRVVHHRWWHFALLGSEQPQKSQSYDTSEETDKQTASRKRKRKNISKTSLWRRGHARLRTAPRAESRSLLLGRTRQEPKKMRHLGGSLRNCFLCLSNLGLFVSLFDRSSGGIRSQASGPTAVAMGCLSRQEATLTSLDISRGIDHCHL